MVFGVVGGLVALEDDRWGRSFVGAEYDCWRREELRIRVGAAVEAADIMAVFCVKRAQSSKGPGRLSFDQRYDTQVMR